MVSTIRVLFSGVWMGLGAHPTLSFIVKPENMFTVRQETNTHRRWRGLYPRRVVGV